MTDQPQLSAKVPNSPDELSIKETRTCTEYQATKIEGEIKIGRYYDKTSATGEVTKKIIWLPVSVSRFNSQFKEV